MASIPVTPAAAAPTTATPATVAVTGAGGFIGAHLVGALLAAGHRVRALVRYASSEPVGALAPLVADGRYAGRLEVLRGDVRDNACVTRLVDGTAAVFHLASLVSVPHSFEAPTEHLDVNVRGTLVLLEALRRRPGPRFVYASSSEVYGNAPTIPITEDSPLLPQSPYAASKAAGDRLVYAYAKTYPPIQALVVRPFNTFGPGQSPRAVIARIILQALEGSVLRLGRLDTRRDFVYVEDLCRFYVPLVTRAFPSGDVVNVGTGRSVSIGDVVEHVGRALGRRLEVASDAAAMRPTTAEVIELRCDATKARAAYGWAPSTTFEQGIAQTVAWFRAHRGAPS